MFVWALLQNSISTGKFCQHNYARQQDLSGVNKTQQVLYIINRLSTTTEFSPMSLSVVSLLQLPNHWLKNLLQFLLYFHGGCHSLINACHARRRSLPLFVFPYSSASEMRQRCPLYGRISVGFFWSAKCKDFSWENLCEKGSDVALYYEKSLSWGKKSQISIIA